MPKLTANGVKWLKGFHLIAVACWARGAVSLVSLQVLILMMTIFVSILKPWKSKKGTRKTIA
jgi:uncharacterized membrane protein